MWNTIKASALVKLARWHASFLCPCTKQKVGDWLMPGCPYQFNLHLQSFGKVYPGCQRPPLKQPTRGKVHTVSGKRWPGRAERRAKRVPWLPSRGIVWNNKKKITPSFGYLFVKHLQRRRKKAPKFKVLLNLNKVYHNCCSALYRVLIVDVNVVLESLIVQVCIKATRVPRNCCNKMSLVTTILLSVYIRKANCPISAPSLCSSWCHGRHGHPCRPVKSHHPHT